MEPTVNYVCTCDNEMCEGCKAFQQGLSEVAADIGATDITDAELDEMAQHLSYIHDQQEG